MSQPLIALLAVAAFASFMGGYWFGWRHRGANLGKTLADVVDSTTIERRRDCLEARVRRSQR